jgi:hypothetical protein
MHRIPFKYCDADYFFWKHYQARRLHAIVTNRNASKPLNSQKNEMLNQECIEKDRTLRKNIDIKEKVHKNEEMAQPKDTDKEEITTVYPGYGRTFTEKVKSVASKVKDQLFKA